MVLVSGDIAQRYITMRIDSGLSPPLNFELRGHQIIFWLDVSRRWGLKSLPLCVGSGEIALYLLLVFEVLNELCIEDRLTDHRSERSQP